MPSKVQIVTEEQAKQAAEQEELERAEEQEKQKLEEEEEDDLDDLLDDLELNPAMFKKAEPDITQQQVAAAGNKYDMAKAGQEGEPVEEKVNTRYYQFKMFNVLPRRLRKRAVPGFTRYPGTARRAGPLLRENR